MKPEGIHKYTRILAITFALLGARPGHAQEGKTRTFEFLVGGPNCQAMLPESAIPSWDSKANKKRTPIGKSCGYSVRKLLDHLKGFGQAPALHADTDSRASNRNGALDVVVRRYIPFRGSRLEFSPSSHFTEIPASPHPENPGAPSSGVGELPDAPTPGIPVPPAAQ